MARNGKEQESGSEDGPDRLNIYHAMAYFLADRLHLRPSEILREWSPPELIVAYGHYCNQISQENYRTWEISKNGPMPKKYFVNFIRR